MSERQSIAAKESWARRKAGPTYQTEAERLAAIRLDDLRKAATAALVQARFGADLARLAEWCVSTCIAGGSSVHTAYLVAGTFTEGLSAEWATGATDGRNDLARSQGIADAMAEQWGAATGATPASEG